MAERIRRLGRLAAGVAWAAVILLLPITSLPLLSRLAGNTMVAPAALIPLALLLPWLLLYLVRRGQLPREAIPFLLFVSLAVISAAMAFFMAPPNFKGMDIRGESLSAVITLFIGAAFYLVASAWLFAGEKRLQLTLRLINLTGIVLLAWAVIQGIYIYVFKSHYPQVLVTFQSLISTRSLFLGRITSFAFEPSWLAQQLNLLFLPFWLAASLTRWSAFKFRIWKFSLENFLLVLGAAVLFVSSRVGTLALLVVLAFLGIYANILVARRLQKWTLSRLGGVSPFLRKLVQILLPVLLLILFLAVYALAAVVLVYGLSHLDYRLARFFKITTLAKLEELTSNIYYLFNYLAFAERFVYWVAGWRVFNLHPLLGVGLGNAGFYFQQVLPAYSWGLPEVMDAYYRASTVPNIKSLWVRLLAETGIVGFSSFGVWCLVCFKSAWSLRKAGTTSQRTIGWFGVFVLLSFLIEGFSTDTFALPYLWLSLGMLCATAALARCAPAGETTSGPSQESIPGKVG